MNLLAAANPNSLPAGAPYILHYVPLLIQFIFAMAFAGLAIGASWLLGRHRNTRRKLSPYECGITPEGDARHRFAVKFYLVAIVFILFDIEAVFLLPWAVVYRGLGWFGFAEMAIYLAIVMTGFLYIWKKGVFDWNTPERAE